MSNDGSDKVAIKIYQIQDQSGFKNFHYEVGILAGLQGHQNIAKLIGYHEQPFSALIMKQYKCSLQSLIDSKSVLQTAETVKYIIREIVNGMQAIHPKGIIHLDLKPLNVLVDENYDGSLRYVICDFGSASIIGEVPKVTGFHAPDNLEYTVRYTAPEVFRRLLMQTTSRPCTEFDKKIDVYSFAITIYELVTLEKGFQGLSTNEIMQGVLNGLRPSWPERIQNDKTYDTVIDLVNRSWVEDSSLRPTFDSMNI